MELNGLYRGIVIDNDDPRGEGRVKVEIPGLIDETPWCKPFGFGFGSAPGIGFFARVSVGSEVVVMFEAGDPERPWFSPAGFDSSDAPSEARDPGNGDWTISFGDVRIRVKLHSEDKTGEITIYTSNTGENYVKIDGRTQEVTVSGLRSVSIRSTGIVDISGGTVLIQGRPVTPGLYPI